MLGRSNRPRSPKFHPGLSVRSSAAPFRVNPATAYRARPRLGGRAGLDAVAALLAVKSPLQSLAHFLGRLAALRQLEQAFQRRPARLARRPGPPPVGGGTRLWYSCYDIFLREGQPMTHGTPPFSADAALRHFRSYFTEPKDVVAHPQLSRDEKLAILREWEQDALRLSTSESEGMGGGEESMLGRVEESIGVLERSPR
jgi:hypothetical protein